MSSSANTAARAAKPSAKSAKPAAKPGGKRAPKPAGKRAGKRAAKPRGGEDLQESQLRRYDFTIPKVVSTTNHTYTAEFIRGFLEEYCSRWVFQEELGDPTELHPEGYEHFQGRVSLIKKRRRSDAINIWNEALPSPGLHLSATSNTIYLAKDFLYCMKGDTRVDGPWTDQDDKFEPKFMNGCVEPRV